MNDRLERLNRLDDNKLMDVVKNYRQYGYDENLREAAISILAQRGISKEELQISGNFVNTTYDFAQELYASFSRNSLIAFLLYGVLLITMIILPIVSSGNENMTIFLVLVKLSTVILYLVFLIKSFLNQSQFYNAIGKSFGSDGVLIYLLLGMPLYIFMYFIFRNQMKEKMKEIK